ncbi:hypothetical protein PI124_g8636 [Phytophthora idaei]|nr:hypothetical protein PI125_g22780 [Phytophthora idaei]KAG3136667.1 hypothetical protein PI126_g17722 [Phytophthora idaei]KAG3246660.1 hypothetical protein PI124_g8636 [Phytophthora idaei]
MTTVISLEAVNKEKFTPWSVQQKVLDIRFASQCLRARLPKLNGWKSTPSTHRVSRAALFALLSTPSATSHRASAQLKHFVVS